jgi:hypothetical protein
VVDKVKNKKKGAVKDGKDDKPKLSKRATVMINEKTSTVKKRLTKLKP